MKQDIIVFVKQSDLDSVHLTLINTYAAFCADMLDIKLIQTEYHGLNPLERIFYSRESPNEVHGHYPYLLYKHHYV